MSKYEDVFLGTTVLVMFALACVGAYHLLLRPVAVNECYVRAEYAPTATDTAALVKRVPHCAEVLYAK